MDNRQLHTLYEDVYRRGEETFFSKYIEGKNVSETDAVVLAATKWQGKSVLDVGCGTGALAARIAAAGAKQVVGIDYSQAAIEAARQRASAENLSFQCLELAAWTKPVNVIVSCGTLEHMDRPWEVLANMGQLLRPSGELIITCPYFLNIRGFIWMALQLLLDVPMSLTDLHFISPFDIETWVKDTLLQLVRVTTFDESLGNRTLMVRDLRKRLTNALRDAKLDASRVDRFIAWLEDAVRYRQQNGNAPLGGATALYLLRSMRKG